MTVVELDSETIYRQEWISQARAMIDFLESKPALLDELGNISLSFYVWGSGPTQEEIDKEAKLKLRRFARLLGKCEKVWTDYSLQLKKNFGNHKIEIDVPRERVCERKVVGTKHVPEYRVAAHDDEIIEWVCEDTSILRAVK